MACQNRLRQGAASETGMRSVRFEIQTCISNPAICDERCTRLQRPSRPLTQAVLTCEGIRGLCENLSGLGVEPISNAEGSGVDATSAEMSWIGKAQKKPRPVGRGSSLK